MHRAAITDRAGAGELMVAIASYDRAVVRMAMQIMAYCFPRPGECRLAGWHEIDFEEAVWTIPAERTKMRREHKIPLARQALDTFRDLHKLTGLEGKLCFPGQRAMNRPISENTICVALRIVQFKRAKAALLPWIGSPAAPIVQALLWARATNAPMDAATASIRRHASKDAKAALARNLRTLPAWAIGPAQQIAENRAT